MSLVMPKNLICKIYLIFNLYLQIYICIIKRMFFNFKTNSTLKSSSQKEVQSKDLQSILAGIQKQMQTQNNSTNRYDVFNKFLSGINKEVIIKYRPRQQSFFYNVMLAFRCGQEYQKEEYILDRLGQLEITKDQTKSFLQFQTIIVKYLLKKSTKQYSKIANQSHLKYLKGIGYLKVIGYLHKFPRKQIQRLLQKRQLIFQEINKSRHLNRQVGKIYIISTKWLQNLQIFLNSHEMNDFPGIITHFQILYLCLQQKSPKLLSLKEVSYISESLWELISKNLAFMQIQLNQKKYKINYLNFNLQKQFQQKKQQKLFSEEVITQLSNSQVSFDRSFLKGISKNQEQFQIKRSSKQKIQLTRRGIRNLGNTCFMNAPLQCLRSCEVWSFTEQQIKKSQFIRQLHKIMKPQLSKNITEQKLQPFQPYQLKDLISQYNPQFKGNSQHDSSTFLISLLQLIDQETAVVQYQVLLNRQNLIDDYDLLNRYKLKEKGISRSFINKHFISRYLVAYRCNKCKYYNNKLMQTQKILNVPIPYNIQKINIQQCLRQFQKSQILQWKCKKCEQQYTEHTKSMQLIQLSQILIIWLKRFQNNNKCQLPLEQCYQLNFPSKNYQFDFVYELFGIVNHSGGLKSGHYTAHCDSGLNEQWWSYNDARVTKVSSRDRHQMFKDAVMLFYRYVGKDQTFNKIVKNK